MSLTILISEMCLIVAMATREVKHFFNTRKVKVDLKLNCGLKVKQDFKGIIKISLGHIPKVGREREDETGMLM